MYLEYTLQKYFDCVPVTIVIPMATAYSQNTFQLYYSLSLTTVLTYLHGTYFFFHLSFIVLTTLITITGFTYKDPAGHGAMMRKSCPNDS